MRQRLLFILAALLLAGCSFRLPSWLRRGETTPRPRPVVLAPAYLLLYEGLAIPEGVEPGDVRTVGCNDRVVKSSIPAVAPRLASALEALSTYETETGSFINPLPRVGLAFEEIERFRGRTVVHLRGKPTFAGTCDPPRVKAVVEETVRLYEQNAEIWLNRYPCEWENLGDLSGKPCR